MIAEVQNSLCSLKVTWEFVFLNNSCIPSDPEVCGVTLPDITHRRNTFKKLEWQCANIQLLCLAGGVEVVVIAATTAAFVDVVLVMELVGAAVLWLLFTAPTTISQGRTIKPHSSDSTKYGRCVENTPHGFRIRVA